MLTPTDPPRVTAVLDWEMATLGDPLMDLGGSMSYWVQDDDDEFFRQFRRQPSNAPGMWTRQQVVDHYCERMGFAVSAEQWRFYEVFGLFRLAVIAQQIWYRYYHRQTTNEAYAVFGPAVGYLEQRGPLADRRADGPDPPGPPRPGVVGRGRLRRAVGDRRAAGRGPRPGAGRPRARTSSSTAACCASSAPRRSRSPRPGGTPRRWIDARWNEMDHLAVLAAQPKDFDGEPDRHQFQAWFEAATTRWTSGAHDDDYAESFPAFRERVAAGLAELAEVDTAVVVTSGGPISAVTADLLAAGLETYTRLAPVVVNTSRHHRRRRPSRPDAGGLQRAPAPGR